MRGYWKSFIMKLQENGDFGIPLGLRPAYSAGLEGRGIHRHAAQSGALVMNRAVLVRT